MPMRPQPCQFCNGTGIAFNHTEFGKGMREKRQQANVQLKLIAMRMKLSISYLSDLEHGKRNWDKALIEAYEKALNE